MFFALLFAIIETAIVFFAGQVLETVTQDSARMIMTGQAQTASYDRRRSSRPIVCNQIAGAVRLRPSVYVDVQSYPGVHQRHDHRSDRRQRQFHRQHATISPGGAGDIVVVRLFYQWPLFVTGLGYNIANLTGSKRLLAATAAFRNEPY